jgi:hypothetical protein
MNAAFSSKIPDVALGTIAAADPFWPPNLVSHSTSAHAIPANAGKAIDDLMLPKKQP